MKKTLAVTAAALTMLALTACGTSTPAPTTSTGGAPAATTDGGAAATTAASEAPPQTTTTSSDPQVTLKFSNVTTNSAKAAGEKFIELVGAYSGGSIIVQHFPDNQLGDDKTVVQSTQAGDIDIVVTSTSSISTLYPDYYLFDTPYLFLNADEVYDIGFDSAAGLAVRDGVDSIGLKGLAMWENGFRNFTNDTRPVLTPEDTKGLKIRTMQNDIHIKAWQAIGANPTPMAFSEVFTAMQQGAIDGEENPIGIIASNKFYEVQKYISLTQHVYTPYAVLMNQARWDGLTPAQQEAITKAMAEATTFQIETSHSDDAASVQVMKDYGCEIAELTDAQKASFQAIVEQADIYSMVKEQMTHPELFDQILDALKAARG